jgi:hypothetical protein
VACATACGAAGKASVASKSTVISKTRLSVGYEFMRQLYWVLQSMLALSICTPALAELPKPAHRRWKQVADNVYLQETSRHVVNVLRQKIAFPLGWIAHFDDRLAFLAYFPLMTYESNPALSAVESAENGLTAMERRLPPARSRRQGTHCRRV